MEQNGTPETKAITEQQLHVLPCLVAASSLPEAAALADIGRAAIEPGLKANNVKMLETRLDNIEQAINIQKDER